MKLQYFPKTASYIQLIGFLTVSLQFSVFLLKLIFNLFDSISRNRFWICFISPKKNRSEQVLFGFSKPVANPSTHNGNECPYWKLFLLTDAHIIQNQLRYVMKLNWTRQTLQICPGLDLLSHSQSFGTF